MTPSSKYLINNLYTVESGSDLDPSYMFLNTVSWLKMVQNESDILGAFEYLCHDLPNSGMNSNIYIYIYRSYLLYSWYDLKMGSL